MKRQVTHWGKIFATFISDNGLLFKINKELFKLNNVKTDHPINKMGKRSEQASSPKIYKLQVSTEKDAQHHISLGNGKLKQGNTITHLSEWPKSRTVTTPMLVWGQWGAPGTLIHC